MARSDREDSRRRSFRNDPARSQGARKLSRDSSRSSRPLTPSRTSSHEVPKQNADRITSRRAGEGRIHGRSRSQGHSTSASRDLRNARTTPASSKSDNGRTASVSRAQERTFRSTKRMTVERGDSSRFSRDTQMRSAVSRQTGKNAGRAAEQSKYALRDNVRYGSRGNDFQGRSRGRSESAFHSTPGIPASVLEAPSLSRKGTTASSSQGGQKRDRLSFGIAWLWGKSRLVTVLLGCSIVVALLFGADALATMNHIYDGVSVGNIDLSGKTVEEASDLIAQEYEPRILSNKITFCADEESVQDTGVSNKESRSLDEQISYEESLATRDRWTTDAEHMGATFDPVEYAQKAYEIGRADGGIFSRFAARFQGVTIDPTCSFNGTALSEMRDEMIKALGNKMVDFNIEMKDGFANVTDGHAGYEVSQDWLTMKLNEGFLQDEGDSRFLIQMEDVPVRINHDQAEETAHIIDASLAQGISFSYEGSQWFADREKLADWIMTEVEEQDDEFVLLPSFDPLKADSTILKGFDFSYNGSGYTVSFSKEADQVVVQTDATGSVPQVNAAVQELNTSFFSDELKTETPQVTVETAQIPANMSLEEALDYGLVVKIDSFTTQYSSRATTRNNNIHLAADALNDSICKAGGTWSFLDLSGEATPEKGYQGAGAIIGGEYSDAVGGGICQVATTVFNAVYEAGYPIERRYNHSLYIASYPAGRDAAIAYPNMDLVWQNDTDSDVLLVMSYTNASVTATLYGVDPGYEVSTVYGEWQEGEPFKTITRQDSEYPVGKEFVETTGADGRSITIIRTVKDANGVVIRENEFSSNYNPKNEIVVKGSGQSSESS